MKVRIFASGEVKHIENSLGSVLISAGLAEVTEAPVTITPLPKPGDFKVPAPRWLVDLQPRAQILVIQMVLLNQFHYFSGLPEHANRSEIWHGQTRWLNGFNRPVPQSIVDEYTRRWNSEPNHRDVPKYVKAGNPNRDEENEARAKEQKRFDDAVLNGHVPFTGGPSGRVIE
jgi:hypothetical protein